MFFRTSWTVERRNVGIVELMNTKNALIGLLLLVCSLTSLSAGRVPVSRRVCFRDAESINDPPCLTDEGTARANLYPQMINDFGQAHNFCPVGFVYSTFNLKPNGAKGTNAPYETAEFLAQALQPRDIDRRITGHLWFHHSFNFELCGAPSGPTRWIASTHGLKKRREAVRDCGHRQPRTAPERSPG